MKVQGKKCFAWVLAFAALLSSNQVLSQSQGNATTDQPYEIGDVARVDYGPAEAGHNGIMIGADNSAFHSHLGKDSLRVIQLLKPGWGVADIYESSLQVMEEGLWGGDF